MNTIPVIFSNKDIRRTLHNGVWWFAVSDVVEVLTGSDGEDTIKGICRRDYELSRRWVEIATPLLLDTPCGQQKVDCTDTPGIFRIVQSIDSPKANQLKSWLAKVGFERVREHEDPELATNLTQSLYRAKEYSETWIAKRMYGIAVQATLTNEWNNRGATGESEHAILAAEISKATFELTPSEHKELKGLERENLRDHMTDLELIFSMLGEAATTEISRKQNAQGFDESRTAAYKGGRIAGEAREMLERETGEKVARRDNYLIEPENQKRLTTKKASNS